MSRLATAAVAAFLAILLWSRTRDLAWMLIVIGVYLELCRHPLRPPRPARPGRRDRAIPSSAFPLARILLSNLPYLFLCAALIVMIRRKRIN